MTITPAAKAGGSAGLSPPRAVGSLGRSPSACAAAVGASAASTASEMPVATTRRIEWFDMCAPVSRGRERPLPRRSRDKRSVARVSPGQIMGTEGTSALGRGEEIRGQAHDSVVVRDWGEPEPDHDQTL